MTSSLVQLPVLLVALLYAAPARVEIDAEVNLTSRYVYRGINLSGDDPALQGRIEYATDLGLYAGVWASGSETAYDQRTTEVDYFAGYQRRLRQDLALDATIIRYTYNGGGVGNDHDWTEGQLTAHLRDHWSFTAAVADDWFGWPGTTWSVEGSWHYAPGQRWMVEATLGHNEVRDAVGSNYQWAELGITRQLGRIHARLGYSVTSGAAYLGDLTDNRWVFTVGWNLAR